MTAVNRTITDAYAEWDDPHAFRVFLTREDVDGNRDEETPMEAVMSGDSIEARLYRAAFVKCAKDLANLNARDRVLGWPTKPPANRVASAVRAELNRIADGKPAPTNEAIQLALALLPRKKAPR